MARLSSLRTTLGAGLRRICAMAPLLRKAASSRGGPSSPRGSHTTPGRSSRELRPRQPKRGPGIVSPPWDDLAARLVPPSRQSHGPPQRRRALSGPWRMWRCMACSAGRATGSAVPGSCDGPSRVGSGVDPSAPRPRPTATAPVCSSPISTSSGSTTRPASRCPGNPHRVTSRCTSGRPAGSPSNGTSGSPTPAPRPSSPWPASSRWWSCRALPPPAGTARSLGPASGAPWSSEFSSRTRGRPRPAVVPGARRRGRTAR